MGAGRKGGGGGTAAERGALAARLAADQPVPPPAGWSPASEGDGQTTKACHPLIPLAHVPAHFPPSLLQSAVQQQEEVDWQATKLFGPRTPALQPVQPVLPARHAAAAAATRPIVVRVVVLVVPVGQHPQQQHVLAALAEHLVEQPTLGGGSGSSNGHIADLLDALAMPAAASAATQLGRKAAAGGTANGDAPASFLQRAAAMPALVAAVNCVFVAACTVSLACMVLLARDAWRHGWVVCGSHRCPDAEELRGEQQQQQFCSTAALLVVAADEAAAMAAEEAVWAKGQL